MEMAAPRAKGNVSGTTEPLTLPHGRLTVMGPAHAIEEVLR